MKILDIPIENGVAVGHWPFNQRGLPADLCHWLINHGLKNLREVAAVQEDHGLARTVKGIGSIYEAVIVRVLAEIDETPQQEKVMDSTPDFKPQVAWQGTLRGNVFRLVVEGPEGVMLEMLSQDRMGQEKWNDIELETEDVYRLFSCLGNELVKT